jgi:peptidyl-prolyl cis-trans isomerase C
MSCQRRLAAWTFAAEVTIAAKHTQAAMCFRPARKDCTMPRFFARARARMPLLAAAAGLLAVAVAFSPASAQNEDAVIAKIGEMTITERDLAFAIADLGDQFSQVPEESRRAAILNALIDVKLLAIEAEKAGVEQQAAFQARMKFLRERALHNTWFQDKALNIVTEEEVKARYEKEVAAMPKQEEVRASHILVKTEQEALDIIKELEAGKDFGELAKTKSTDPSAASNNGDLGFFGKGQMVPEFEGAVFALKNGEYTKVPVKTQFGFHVIRRVEDRVVPPPPFADVEAQVRQIVVREKYAALVEAARKASTIEVLDEKLKQQVDALNAQQQQ